MGKTKGLNVAEFEVGVEVRIADRVARVKEVTFFHGGDEIYSLEGMPGVWHEACLRAV